MDYAAAAAGMMAQMMVSREDFLLFRSSFLSCFELPPLPFFLLSISRIASHSVVLSTKPSLTLIASKKIKAPLDQSERDGSANQQSRDESGTDSDGSDALTVSNGGRAGHHVEDGDGAVLLKKDARVSFAEEEDAAEDDDDDDRDVDMESAGAGSGFGDDEEDGPAAEEQGQLGGHDGDANDGDDGAGTDMERLPSEVKIEED